MELQEEMNCYFLHCHLLKLQQLIGTCFSVDFSVDDGCLLIVARFRVALLFYTPLED